MVLTPVTRTSPAASPEDLRNARLRMSSESTVAPSRTYGRVSVKSAMARTGWSWRCSRYHETGPQGEGSCCIATATKRPQMGLTRGSTKDRANFFGHLRKWLPKPSPWVYRATQAPASQDFSAPLLTLQPEVLSVCESRRRVRADVTTRGETQSKSPAISVLEEQFDIIASTDAAFRHDGWRFPDVRRRCQPTSYARCTDIPSPQNLRSNRDAIERHRTDGALWRLRCATAIFQRI